MEVRKLEDWCKDCKNLTIPKEVRYGELTLTQIVFRLDTCIECLRNYIGKRTDVWQPPDYRKTGE